MREDARAEKAVLRALHWMDTETNRSGDVVAGLKALRRLRTALTEVQTEQVAAARRAGKSWSEVGAALGVTKQSAHATYGEALQPERMPPPRRAVARRQAGPDGAQQPGSRVATCRGTSERN